MWLSRWCSVGTDPRAAREQAIALFPEFGLTGTEDRYPAQLSGGMRQRAALLRTYLFGKSVALLDEPFSALDTITKSSIHRWYLDVMEKIKLSTLFITHDIDEAILLSDRIYILTGHPGRITDEITIPVPKPRPPRFHADAGVSGVQAADHHFYAFRLNILPKISCKSAFCTRFFFALDKRALSCYNAGKRLLIEARPRSVPGTGDIRGPRGKAEPPKCVSRWAGVLGYGRTSHALPAGYRLEALSVVTLLSSKVASIGCNLF